MNYNANNNKNYCTYNVLYRILTQYHHYFAGTTVKYFPFFG